MNNYVDGQRYGCKVLGFALSCLAMVAAGASGNVEHMGKLCESNVIEATMNLMTNGGWKSLSDDTLTVCHTKLSWSSPSFLSYL